MARRFRRSIGSRTEPSPHPGDPAQARGAALRFLSYRERSREEVAGKLRERGFSERLVAETLDYLAGLGYLDDRRFTQSWIRTRMMGKGYGRDLLRHELLQKGVLKGVIEEVLLEEETDEKEAARRLLTKRFSTTLGAGPGPLDPKGREKAYQFLHRRGFPSEVIRAVLKTWLQKELD